LTTAGSAVPCVRMDEPHCDICGKPASVRVLERYADGEPVFKRYCLECAQRVGGAATMKGGATSRHRMSRGSLLIAAGVLIVIVAATGDYIGIRGSSGFGWYQALGICLGALFVLIGALLGVDVFAIFGTIVFGLAACSDLLGIAGVPGIGWKQNLAIFAGVVMTTVGVILRFRT
jgi:hypothetical protein